MEAAEIAMHSGLWQQTNVEKAQAIFDMCCAPASLMNMRRIDAAAREFMRGTSKKPSFENAQAVFAIFCELKDELRVIARAAIEYISGKCWNASAAKAHARFVRGRERNRLIRGIA